MVAQGKSTTVPGDISGGYDDAASVSKPLAAGKQSCVDTVVLNDSLTVQLSFTQLVTISLKLVSAQRHVELVLLHAELGIEEIRHSSWTSCQSKSCCHALASRRRQSHRTGGKTRQAKRYDNRQIP